MTDLTVPADNGLLLVPIVMETYRIQRIGYDGLAYKGGLGGASFTQAIHQVPVWCPVSIHQLREHGQAPPKLHS